MERTAGNNTRLFILAFVLLGCLLAALTFFIPLKYGILALLGLAFVIFSFFYLDISLGLFLFAMAVAPDYLWNNKYILLSAFFFMAVYAVQLIAGKRDAKRLRGVPVSFFVFILAAVLSLFVSLAISDSLRVLSIMASCMLFGLVFYLVVDNEKTFERIVWLLFIAMTLTSLYGFYQVKRGIEINFALVDVSTNADMPGRLFSTFLNPNNYAEFLMMGIPLCAAYLVTRKNDVKKLLCAAMLGICLIALVMTLSRASYITLLVGVLLFVFIVNPRLIPIIIVLGLLAIPLVPDVYIRRLMTTGTDSSSTYRFQIWSGALRTLAQNWLLGIGMGPQAFKLVYLQNSQSQALNAMHSHNLILQIWIETGLLGFLSFMTYAFTLVKRGYVTARQAVRAKTRYFSAGLCASLVAIVLFGFVEYVWFYPRVMLMFWILCGLFMAANRFYLPEGRTER